MSELGLNEQELADQRKLGRHSQRGAITSHSMNPELTVGCWRMGIYEQELASS